MSSQSRARCPLRRQVTQICMSLQVPGKAHLPLFHELQTRSSVSGRTAPLMGWEAACPYVPGAWIGCKDARAHWASQWSGSRHNFHVRVAPERREMIVAASIQFVPRKRCRGGCLLLVKPLVVLHPAWTTMALCFSDKQTGISEHVAGIQVVRAHGNICQAPGSSTPM